MGLHEDDERRRLADPFDPMHHDGVSHGFRAAGLVVILTIIVFFLVQPGEFLGPLVLTIGAALAAFAFHFTRKWMKSK